MILIISDGTNRYFDVMFESAIRVICSYCSPPGNQIPRNKSCSIAYGSCQQASATTMTAQNMTSSGSLTVVVNLQSPLSNGNCYIIITASSGASSTIKTQGTFSICNLFICLPFIFIMHGTVIRAISMVA